MIKNSKITIYHKGLDKQTKLETWTPYNYTGWIFNGKNASVNKGYSNSNNIELRIPYEGNSIDISNIAIGDIVVKGKIIKKINTQHDLQDTYNITSIKNNSFGSEPHIHVGGM